MKESRHLMPVPFLCRSKSLPPNPTTPYQSPSLPRPNSQPVFGGGEREKKEPSSPPCRPSADLMQDSKTLCRRTHVHSGKKKNLERRVCLRDPQHAGRRWLDTRWLAQIDKTALFSYRHARQVLMAGTRACFGLIQKQNSSSTNVHTRTSIGTYLQPESAGIPCLDGHWIHKGIQSLAVCLLYRHTPPNSNSNSTRLCLPVGSPPSPQGLQSRDEKRSWCGGDGPPRSRRRPFSGETEEGQ